MLPCLFVLLYFLQFTMGVQTNTTTAVGYLHDSNPIYRSSWTLFASCGLTLLICIWYTIHPAVPLPQFRTMEILLYRSFLMLVTLFIPELVVAVAFNEWREARQITKRVRGDYGYKWWTMAHSHFVLNGGFCLCDAAGIREIDIDEFLLLLLMGKENIVNPVITKTDIKDKSTADGLGKAIFVVQLIWFLIQIIIRHINHLSVTLLELDTACIALLTFPLMFFWWKKPYCPRRPHIFYLRNVRDDERMSSGDDDTEKLVANSKATSHRNVAKLLAPAELRFCWDVAFLVTWSILGALHAIAWNYEFLTEAEKILWRVSSLVLATTPVIFWVIFIAMNIAKPSDHADNLLLLLRRLLVALGVISRLALGVLMFASLRSLPSSAYQTIPWTNYMPHLQ